jgi:hypothetical protein
MLCLEKLILAAVFLIPVPAFHDSIVLEMILLISLECGVVWSFATCLIPRVP